MLKCKAIDVDDPTDQPRWGRVGKQTIEVTGALTKKRMETIDDETSDAAVDTIKRQVAGGKTLFCWYNSTRMHLRTHIAPEQGHEAAGRTFKVHLDGYDQLAYLTGQAEKSPRRGFFYFNDDGDLVSLRVENWKVVFMEQRAPGTLRVWAEPFTPLRLPKLFDLRADPYERADVTSNTDYDRLVSQPYLIFVAQAATSRFLDTFKEFPPRQKAPSFSVDQAVQTLQAA